MKFCVFDYSRENFYYERVLFITNPGTPHVWVPVWAKKCWQSTQRKRLAASWTSEVKIFNFVPLQWRYIKIATFLYNFSWFSLKFHSKLLVGSFWGIENLPKLNIAKISFFLISEHHLAIVVILLIGLAGQLELLDSWIGQFWLDFHDLCNIGKLLTK